MSHDPVIYQRGDIVHYRDNVGDLIIAKVLSKEVDAQSRALLLVRPTHYAAEPHVGEFGLPERKIEKSRSVPTRIGLSAIEKRGED